MMLSLAAKLLTIVAGFVVQRAILTTYLSEINGLTSTISQFLGYLTLIEAGLGTASIQALYKPLAENDWEKASGILSATEILYRKTGLMFLGLLTGLSLLMPIMVNSTLEVKLIALLTFLTGMGDVISYLFMGRYTALLTADQNISVIYSTNMIGTIISSVSRIILINAEVNILIVQAATLMTVIIKMLILRFYVKKHYKHINYKSKPDYKATSKRWSVLIHNIAGMVVFHTDMIILSIFDSLKMVSVYNVYNYVFSNINSILHTTFSTAPLATFGHLYSRKDEKFDDFYSAFELFYMILMTIVFSTALVMILPFVTLYVDKVSDINYFDPMLAILFFVIGIMNLVRLPSLIMINASGSFKETQKGAIIEAIINITVSLILLKPLGVYGLLLGTCISYLYRTTDVIVYSYKHIIHRSMFKFLKLALPNIISLATIVVPLFFINKVTVTSWLDWVLKAFIVVIISALVTLLINVIFNKKLTISAFKNIKHFI